MLTERIDLKQKPKTVSLAKKTQHSPEAEEKVIKNISSAGHTVKQNVPEHIAEKITAERFVADRKQDRRRRLNEQRQQAPVVQEKTATQKRDEAQQLYDAYIQSDEYKQNLVNNMKDQTDEWMNATLYGSEGYTPAPRKDQKEQELKALVDHYTAQAQKEEDQATLGAALQELETWDEADRKALEAYWVQDAWERQHPMADPLTGGSRQVSGEIAAPLFAKYGEAKVRKLAEALEWQQSAELAEQTQAKGRETAGERFFDNVGADALSIAEKGVGNLSGLLGYVTELGRRTGQFSTLNPNNIGQLPNVHGDAIQGQKAENLAADGGKLDAYLYQGGMSAADSGLRLLMGGGAAGGAVLSATGSFARTVSEASSQGATPGEAAALGIVNAGIEYATEKVPLDKLMDAAKAGGHGWKEILKNALIQGGIEAGEEELSLIGTTLAEAAILREKSGYQQRIQELVASGMNLKDAQNAAFGELMQEAKETAIVSFFSGGLSEAGASVAGNLTHRAADRAEDAAEMQQTEENAADNAAPVKGEPESAVTPEEAAEQLGRESPKAEPVQKTEQEMTLDQAMRETFGQEGNDFGSRAAELERAQAQEESLRGAAEAYANAGDARAAAEVEADRQKYGDRVRSAQDQEEARTGSLADQDAPAPGEAPYPGSRNQDSDPLQARSWEEAGSRKTKAYMAENPEVKPFIQQEAQAMAEELSNTTKGERTYDEQLHYDSGGEKGWYGVKRHTSEDIAELRDSGMSYEQIDKGLNDIIEDHGKENSAAAKRVEMQLNDRLRTGHKDFMTGKWVQPNQAYIDTVNEAEANREGRESFDALMEDADTYAPPAQDAERGTQQADTGRVSPLGKQAGIKGTGAAEQNFAGTAAYEDLLSDDNVQRERKGAARSDEVPKYDAKGRPVSEFAGNSMTSRITPDSFTTTIKQMVADGWASHDIRSNDQSLREAAQAITDSGSVYDCLQEIREVAKQGRTSVQDVAKAELIYNHLVNQDNEEAQRMAADAWVTLSQLATNSGRATQIFSVFQRMTPDSQCMVLEKEVKLFAEKMKGKGHVLKNYVSSVDPGLLQDYRKAAQEYQKAKTEDAKQEAMEQMSFIQDAVYQAEAAKLPATFKAKWDAWRYMCMLGNVKTQVRNIAGNAAFRPYKDVKDAIGAGLERLAGLDKSQRTKAVLNIANEGDRQLLSWAKADAKSDTVRNALKYSAKLGDDVTGSKMEEKVQVFDTKALEAVRKFIEKVPAEADLLFKNGHYERSLAGFLKARGYSAADLQAGRVQDAVLNEARSYAVDEAMKATFNDCNAFSDFFASIGRNPAKKDNPFTKAFNVAAEGVLPFRRTPANIVVRFTEYSPVGLTKGVWDAATKIRNGEISAAAAIDQMAAGVTGTAAMALGFFLAKGIGGFKLKGSGVDEDEERQGHQAYSVEFSIDGREYSYRIDWAAPANLPLFVGANLYELMTGDGEDDVEVSKLTSFLYSLGTMFEPMLSLSCLSSLNDLFEAGKYSDGNALYSVAAQMATSYITQGVPALARQAVQAASKNQQATFANDEDPLVRDLQRMGAQTGVMPWLKTDKVNAWGETEGQENGLLRAFNAFINPGTLKEIDNGQLEQEVTRLNESQPDSVSPPDTPKTISYTDANGERISGHRLTEEEYNTLATVQGQTAKGILDEVLKSDTYAAMTDQQKASVFEYVYDYAREKGRTAALEGYEGLDGWMEGIEGNAADAILDKAVKNAFTDAFEQLEHDPEGAAAALDQAYELVDPHGLTEWAKEAGGRTKYFVEAKRRGVDAATFAGLYQQFRDIDQNPDYNTGDKAAEWSYQLQKAQEAGTITKQQKDALKDSMVYYQMFPAETAKFDQMTEAGISADKAFKIGDLLDGIKPQEGYTNVRDVQKAGAIADNTSLSRSEKTAVMKIYLSDAQDENLDLMLGLGYGPEDYAAVYEIYSGESGKGKKARTISKIQDELGVDYGTAREIYEIYG